jgi:hypothetical protein
MPAVAFFIGNIRVESIRGDEMKSLAGAEDSPARWSHAFFSPNFAAFFLLS